MTRYQLPPPDNMAERNSSVHFSRTLSQTAAYLSCGILPRLERTLYCRPSIYIQSLNLWYLFARESYRTPISVDTRDANKMQPRPSLPNPTHPHHCQSFRPPASPGSRQKKIVGKLQFIHQHRSCLREYIKRSYTDQAKRTCERSRGPTSETVEVALPAR